MQWATEHLFIFITIIFILGLIIGSFLNVVIHRLPIMLDRNWRQQCQEYLKLENDPVNHTQKIFNIALPASHCPHCQHPLKPWHNIPLISFILLRGKCTYCQEKISWQYPLVELTCAVMTVIVFLRFGISHTMLFSLVLSWSLLALFVIDWQQQILPDTITIPVLWLGLFINLQAFFTDITSAILGAIIGYLSLWIINKLFKLVRGLHGIGYGDFKLFALLGAWVGWQLLPFILVIASILGAIAAGFLMLYKGHHKQTPIAFGPYLAIAGWIALLWGQPVLQWYIG